MTQDLGWAAGIIDGEGCITVGRKRTKDSVLGWRYALLIDVTNTSRVMLLRLRMMFGGTISVERRSLTGKAFWQWRLYGRGAQGALAILEPYLIAKRAQAQIALRYPVGPNSRYRSYTCPVSQAVCYLALKRLNNGALVYTL